MTPMVGDNAKTSHTHSQASTIFQTFKITLVFTVQAAMLGQSLES